MPQFWVVGGEYTDTHFQDALAPGEEWAKLAWRTVDECTTRYRIERIDPEAPPPCTD